MTDYKAEQKAAVDLPVYVLNCNKPGEVGGLPSGVVYLRQPDGSLRKLRGSFAREERKGDRNA